MKIAEIIVDGFALVSHGDDGRGPRKVHSLSLDAEKLRPKTNSYVVINKAKLVNFGDGCLAEIGEIFRDSGKSLAEEIRERALSKLTEEEKEALGLI